VRWIVRLALFPILGMALAFTFSLSASAAPLAEDETHIVQPGETLSVIAAQHGVAIAEIAQANSLANVNTIYVGQKLRIPGGSSSASDPSASEERGSAPATEAEPAPEVYLVQPGDTLAGIAERFGVSAVSLARANRLSNPSLVFAGRRLTIPKPRIARLDRGGKWVKVSISRQRCWVYDGDTLLYEWACSTGRASSPTKAGTYVIQSKIRTAYGSTWNIWMPYWLGLYWAGGTENGFHGMPWNAATGRQTWPGLVGTPITYGCIMLTNENAEILWEMAYIGMPVTIEY
jgi:LysM repeat protein